MALGSLEARKPADEFLFLADTFDEPPISILAAYSVSHGNLPFVVVLSIRTQPVRLRLQDKCVEQDTANHDEGDNPAHEFQVFP